MSEDMRSKIEQALDRLASALPPEPERKPPEPEHYVPQRVARRADKALSPHLQPKQADTLLPEHRALIGKWATVDLPDNAGTARLRVYTVTVRRDGRVRAELRPPEGFTVYRTPDQLRDVGDTP